MAEFTNKKEAKRMAADLAVAANKEHFSEVQTYSETKALSSEYQYVKGLLYGYCESSGYGTWLRKPTSLGSRDFMDHMTDSFTQ